MAKVAIVGRPRLAASAPSGDMLCFPAAQRSQRSHRATELASGGRRAATRPATLLSSIRRHSFSLDLVKLSLQLGGCLLLEVGEDMLGFERNAALEHLLCRTYSEQKDERTVQILSQAGSATHCEVSESFSLYLYCEIPNPQFGPNVFSRHTVINFAVGPEVLEQRLLEVALATEAGAQSRQLAAAHAALETARGELTVREDAVLHVLATAEGHVLDDGQLRQSVQAVGDAVEAAKARATAQALAEEQARLERTPSNRSLALVTGHPALFAFGQCVRHRSVAPATAAQPSGPNRGRWRNCARRCGRWPCGAPCSSLSWPTCPRSTRHTSSASRASPHSSAPSSRRQRARR